MNKIDQYVSKLDDETRHAIVAEYKNFEKTGSTGDTILRQTVNELLLHIGIDADGFAVVQYMDYTASAIWKYYYMQQFGDLL